MPELLRRRSYRDPIGRSVVDSTWFCYGDEEPPLAEGFSRLRSANSVHGAGNVSIVRTIDREADDWA